MGGGVLKNSACQLPAIDYTTKDDISRDSEGCSRSHVFRTDGPTVVGGPGFGERKQPVRIEKAVKALKIKRNMED